MVNQSLRGIAGPFPEESVMFDWWLALVASAFGRLDYLPFSTVLYRQHSRNTIGVKSLVPSPGAFGLGLQVRRAKDIIERTFRQAEKFKDVFSSSLTSDKRKTIDAFLGLRSQGWAGKRASVLRHGFSKSGFLRNLGWWIFL